MVDRRGLLLVAIALAAPLLAQGQAPRGLLAGPTNGAKFPAGGVTVPVPAHPECVLTVESWENGSFLVPDGQPRPAFSVAMRNRWLKPGTRDTDEQAGRDEREIASQLTLALKYSPDMVDKVTKACTIRGSIAIRLVRDDPFVNVGHTVGDSNLVMIDMSDLAKTALQVATVHPPGTADLTRDEAPVQAGRAFTYGLLAHEVDHLQETGDGKHSDPGRNAALGDEQGGAVRDENQVMEEMGLKFQRPTYINVQNGRSVIVYEADNQGQMTTAIFDPAKAIAAPVTRANGAATEHHFVPEDAETADGIEDRCCGCGGALCSDLPTSTFGTVSRPRVTTVIHSPLTLNFAPIGSGEIPEPGVDRYFFEAAEKILRVIAARRAEGVQKMGGSVLSSNETSADFSRREPMPSWPSLGRVGNAFATLARPTRPAARASLGASPVRLEPWSQAHTAGSPIPPSSVIAVFTSLGRSSGAAFRMDVVHDGPGPIRALGDGFVLEPLASVTAQQVQNDLARLKGRRSSATIVAYCLEFTKTPPALDTIYRLVPPDAAKAHANLPAIMVASKRLLSSGRLHPDSGAEEYFHAIRQWALWSDEQGWRTEEEFGRAFMSHAKKNLASAGRPWTAQIEAAIRKIVPGRWRDIEAVRVEAAAQRR